MMNDFNFQPKINKKKEGVALEFTNKNIIN